jgi:hypothetical protein
VRELAEPCVTTGCFKVSGAFLAQPSANSYGCRINFSVEKDARKRNIFT